MWKGCVVMRVGELINILFSFPDDIEVWGLCLDPKGNWSTQKRMDIFQAEIPGKPVVIQFLDEDYLKMISNKRRGFASPWDDPDFERIKNSLRHLRSGTPSTGDQN